MMVFNKDAAIKTALEIAKVVCANPNTNIQPNKQSAEELADFIRTLEARFLSEDQKS